MIENVKLSPTDTVLRSTCERTPGAAPAIPATQNTARAKTLFNIRDRSNTISNLHCCREFGLAQRERESWLD